MFRQFKTSPKRFAAARPFPHLVESRVFKQRLLHEVLEGWPADGEGWIKHRSTKRAFPGCEGRYGVFDVLSSPEFMSELERVTGVRRLVYDLSLSGGGLHETFIGGALPVHVDFNVLEVEGRRLYRRVNLLLFLNETWHDAWGGHCELWREGRGGPKRRHVAVTPEMGSCLVFEASDHSWHGQPGKVVCPRGLSRRSLACYYYTEDPPPGVHVVPHSTVYVPKNERRRS